ncbi:hypothetical protein CARUB_v10007891mg, partial [Capsella rubella]
VCFLYHDCHFSVTTSSLFDGCIIKEPQVIVQRFQSKTSHELQDKTQCDVTGYKWGLATLDGLHSDFNSTENFIGFIELEPDHRNKTVEPDTPLTSLTVGDGSYKIITVASEFNFLPP